MLYLLGFHALGKRDKIMFCYSYIEMDRSCAEEKHTIKYIKSLSSDAE